MWGRGAWPMPGRPRTTIMTGPNVSSCQIIMLRSTFVMTVGG